MYSTYNSLPAFRQKLEYITQSDSQPDLEKRAARFYLDTLAPYNDRDLVRQHGFNCGVGGSGDNVVIMPLVERDQNGTPLTDDKGDLLIAHCVFKDFQAYLSYINRRQPVRDDYDACMSLPDKIDGMRQTDYIAIWYRHLGLRQVRTPWDTFEPRDF